MLSFKQFAGLLAILRVTAGVLLVASVALNFANVVGRYFFSASIYWAEEVMLFLMVGCVFLGNGVVAWSGRQIRMDVIVGMMPPQAREGARRCSPSWCFIVVAITIVVFRLAGDPRPLQFRPAQPVRRNPAGHPAVADSDRAFASWRSWSVVRLLTGGDRDAVRHARVIEDGGAP